MANPAVGGTASAISQTSAKTAPQTPTQAVQPPNALGNDYGYDQLFRRQLEANGVAGDVFLGISTSGNSPNILQALEAASEKGVTTFGMTGESGGAMRELCDYCLCVPSAETPRIQEAHILIGHTLCAMVELALFADLQPQ